MTVTPNNQSGGTRGGVNELHRVGRPVSKRSKSRDFRHAIVTSLAFFVVWAPLIVLLILAVITRSLAAYLAETQPERAVQLQATNPTALVNLAMAELKRDRDQSDEGSSAPVSIDRPQIRAWAERALRNDPLNARAFGILGLLSEGHADQRRTEALMRGAAHRSLHESAAVYWLMQKSYEDQNYEEAIRYADTLLRMRQDRSGITAPVVSVLAKIAEQEDGKDKVMKVLTSNPPWRGRFFGNLPNSITDARTPLELVLALKQTSAPPTSDELRAYLDFLIEHKFYDLAYYAWLQFLPLEQLKKVGRLFNGNFEAPRLGMPFDWQFKEAPGVRVEVAARTDLEGEHALLIEFGPGRVDFPGIAQLVMLAPGRYELRGKQRGSIESRMGLRWRISCAGRQESSIGEGPTVNGTLLVWTDFAFPFTVPETECGAQYVRLDSEARFASEQFVSGSIWFDDLEIVRKGADQS